MKIDLKELAAEIDKIQGERMADIRIKKCLSKIVMAMAEKCTCCTDISPEVPDVPDEPVEDVIESQPVKPKKRTKKDKESTDDNEQQV